MEVGFGVWAMEANNNGEIASVLILILVEVGFGEKHLYMNATQMRVLILILVEVGFGALGQQGAYGS